VGGINFSKLAIIGKTTKRRTIRIFKFKNNFKYIINIKLPGMDKIITHLEFTNDWS
jgi:hypothetical protein